MSYQLVCSEPYTYTAPDWVCGGVVSSIEVNPSFDVSTLDASAVVGAIASGFIVAGVPLLTIMVCRIILETIKGKKL